MSEVRRYGSDNPLEERFGFTRAVELPNGLVLQDPESFVRKIRECALASKLTRAE